MTAVVREAGGIEMVGPLSGPDLESVAQATAVSDAATVAPDRQEDLVQRARRVTVNELRDDCARTKAAARAPTAGTVTRPSTPAGSCRSPPPPTAAPNC